MLWADEGGLREEACFILMLWSRAAKGLKPLFFFSDLEMLSESINKAFIWTSGIMS